MQKNKTVIHYENLLAMGCFSRNQLVELVGTSSATNGGINEYFSATDKRFSDFEKIAGCY
jgi:hypothetical protein